MFLGARLFSSMAVMAWTGMTRGRQWVQPYSSFGVEALFSFSAIRL